MTKHIVDQSQREISCEYLRSRLDYGCATGDFVWLPRAVQCWQDNAWNARWAGKRAGATDRAGYICIRLDFGLYRAHRLAYLWMTGEQVHHEIDHKDTNRSNNAWANLRPATRSQNACNCSARIDNTSGVKGVCWNKQKGNWKACIHFNGKAYNVGSFSSVERAAVAMAEYRIRLHGEFGRVS